MKGDLKLSSHEIRHTQNKKKSAAGTQDSLYSAVGQQGYSGPVQCSGTARVYDSDSYLLSRSEEQGTNAKDEKNVSDQDERPVNSE